MKKKLCDFVVNLLQQSLLEKTIEGVALLTKEQIDILNISFHDSDFVVHPILEIDFQFKQISTSANNHDYFAFRKRYEDSVIQALKLNNLKTQFVVIQNKQYPIFAINQAIIENEALKIEEIIDLNKEKKLFNEDDDWKSAGQKVEVTLQNLNTKLKKKPVNEKVNNKLYDELDLNAYKKTNTDVVIATPESKTTTIIPSQRDPNYNDTTFETFADEEFDPVVDYSSLIRTKNHHAFWFLTDTSYTGVDATWEKLKQFYSLSPTHLNRLLQEIDATSTLPVSQHEQTLISYAPQKTTYIQTLNKKISDLNEKASYLDNYLIDLQEKLDNTNVSPQDNEEFLLALKQKTEIHQQIVNSKLSLEKYHTRLTNFKNKYSNFKVNFYIGVFGKNVLLTKYDEIIGEKLIALNIEINQVVLYHAELEKTLVHYLEKIHEAKKIKTKHQFLEHEEQKNQLLNRYKTSAEFIEREKRKKLLEEMGQLSESEADIKTKIIDEKRKIDYYLSNLKSIEQIDDYEARLIKNKDEKQVFQKKKEDFEKYIHNLRAKIYHVENSFNSFFSEIGQIVSDFQKETTEIYSKNQNILAISTQKLWQKWHEQGIKLINNIFEKKKTIIYEFSDVILLQIKNIYAHQKRNLNAANKRQEEWENIYQEIKNEFKILGYYLDTPKPTEFNKKYIKDLDINKLKLSKDVNKLIHYQPNFNLVKKNNELFGLDLKLLDDDNFLVIDQVWTTLTKEQEDKLKEKVYLETSARDAETLKKKFKELKNKINANLAEQKYQFQKTNIFDFLPSDEEAAQLNKKLSTFEHQLLHAWKEENYTSSNVRGNFKETIFNLAKKLFTIKSVSMNNDELTVSDTGKTMYGGQTEIFSEKDYFIKPKQKEDMSNFEDLIDLSVDDSEIFEIEDDQFLELIDNLDDIEDEKTKMVKPPKMPTLEEWAHISIQKFREKRKTIEVDHVKNKLLQMEEEIEKITQIHISHQNNMNYALSQRNALFDEIQSDLSRIQQFLISQEHELNLICDNVKKVMDEKIQLANETSNK